jgi:hypothetical protein
MPLTANMVLRIIRDAEFKLDGYAETYVNALPRAEAEYGERGVRVQILYILSNMRASGPKQKEAKKQLQKLAKTN